MYPSRWINRLLMLAMPFGLAVGAAASSCNVAIDVPGAEVNVDKDRVYVSFPGGQVDVRRDRVLIEWPCGRVSLD